MQEETSTLGSYQIIQTLLHFLIRAAWSTAWEVLLQEKRWWIQGSNADVDGPAGSLSSHLLSDPLNLWTCVFFTWTHFRSSWIKSKQAANCRLLVDTLSFFQLMSGQAVSALIPKCKNPCLPLLSWAEKLASQEKRSVENKIRESQWRNNQTYLKDTGSSYFYFWCPDDIFKRQCQQDCDFPCSEPSKDG